MKIPFKVDPAVQEGPCLQEGDHRQLLHRLQGRSGQRGGRQRRLMCLLKCQIFLL